MGLKRAAAAVLCLTAGLTLLSGAEIRRELDFGGQKWRIKATDELAGPGPNYWAGTGDAVWVDEHGLNLTIRRRDDGRWYATEVFTRRPLGYGTYTFVIDSDISSYGPNIVAGFFTWDAHPDEANREIDIEFASWGIPGGALGHYVVQPITGDERIHIFDPRLQGTYTTHRIIWTPERLDFSSYHGDIDPDVPFAPDYHMESWSFEGTPPTEGEARFRINLWLFLGQEPDAELTRLTVRYFDFKKFDQ